MKTLIKITIVFILLVTTQLTYGQAKKESVLFEIFYGSPYAEIYNAKQFDLEESNGLYGARIEFEMNKIIGFGIELSYANTTVSSKFPVYTDEFGVIINANQLYEFSVVRYLPRVDFHLAKSEKFDLNLSISYGGYILKGDDPNKVILTQPNVITFGTPSLTPVNPLFAILEEFDIPFSSRLSIGGKYYFTENLGFNIATGLGGGYLIKAGLVYKV